jgi:hypothetical protein
VSTSVEVAISYVVSKLIDIARSSLDAEVICTTAADYATAPMDDEVPFSESKRLALVANALGEELSIDAIVDKEDDAG